MAFTKTWGEAMCSERLNSSCYTSDYSLGKIDFTKTWGEAICSERLNAVYSFRAHGFTPMFL
jgi:hypothetical protein